jgi:hypothetical protein
MRITILSLFVVASVNAAGQTLDYSNVGGTLSESFNSLPVTGVTSFSNGITSPGLYAFEDYLETGAASSASRISASHGHLSHGGFFSLGAVGSGERAFGSISGGNGAIGVRVFGLAIRNTTGQTLTQADISFWGEQWSITQNRHSLLFSFLVSNAPSFTGPNSNYQRITELDFSTPDWGAFGPLNGNAAQNRQFLSRRITGLSWAPNQVLSLRWYDPLGFGDPAMGIDDLTVQAVPEPFTMSALALGLAAIARKRARKS